MAQPPVTNEAFLREVDEELRRDSARRIWQRWGRWIALALVAAIAALGGWFWLQERKSAAAGVEGERMSSVIAELEANQKANVGGRLDELAKSETPGYAASARLTQAATAIGRNDLKGAAAIYATIVADEKLAKPYRDLALVRQTAAEFDTLKPEQVVQRLKPLAAAGNPWFGSAGEMVAISYMRMNKPELAGPLFAAMAKDEGVPETIRSRAVQLAGVLGVDAVQTENKETK